MQLRCEFLAELPLVLMTVLSDLWYNLALIQRSLQKQLNWKQRTAFKAVKDALQYIKKYVIIIITDMKLILRIFNIGNIFIGALQTIRQKNSIKNYHKNASQLKGIFK